MNPDNPSFRTPEEDQRAEEYVALKGKYQALLAEAAKLRGRLREILDTDKLDTDEVCSEIAAFDQFTEGQGE